MKKYIHIITIPCILVLVILLVIFSAFHKRNKLLVKYETALELANNGDYGGAIILLNELGDNYRDVPDIKEDLEIKIKYEEAQYLFSEEKYEEAKLLFINLGDYRYSKLYIAQIEVKNIEASKKLIYEEASKLLSDKQYKKALDLFLLIPDYCDTNDMIEKCMGGIKS